MSLKHSKYKIGLLIIKYCPILMGLIMYLHTLLAYQGIEFHIATTLAGSAILPSIIIFSISSMLEFCYIHKSFTLYALVNDLYINYTLYFNFGESFKSFQFISIIIGTVLFLLLSIKLKMYHIKCCSIREKYFKYLESIIKYK